MDNKTGTVTITPGSFSWSEPVSPEEAGNRRPYNPRKRDVLPFIKPGYRGKNPAGGRKAVFSQSIDYQSREVGVAIPWEWTPEQRKRHREAREEYARRARGNGN